MPRNWAYLSAIGNRPCLRRNRRFCSICGATKGTDLRGTAPLKPTGTKPAGVCIERIVYTHFSKEVLTVTSSQ